ncbi:MAG TPA: hypothetical protein VNR89_17980 [Roseomonas sp.]|nr:hypothetical protein [Roseomonas sp.]
MRTTYALIGGLALMLAACGESQTGARQAGPMGGDIARGTTSGVPLNPSGSQAGNPATGSGVGGPNSTGIGTPSRGGQGAGSNSGSGGAGGGY